MQTPLDQASPLDEVKMIFDPNSGKLVVTVPKKRFIASIPFDWIESPRVF